MSSRGRALSETERRFVDLASWLVLAGALLSAVLAVEAWRGPCASPAPPVPGEAGPGDLAEPADRRRSLTRVLRVYGVVRAEDGRPITDAGVRSSHAGIETVSDLTGRYTLSVPDPGATTRLHFSATGFAAQEVMLEPEWLGLEAIALDVTLAPMPHQGEVVGLLRSATGEPIASETIELRPVEADSFHSAESDAEGAFTIAGLPVGGLYDLVVRPRGPYARYLERGIRIPPEGLALEVVLDPLATRRLTGRTVDVEGRPIPNLRLWLRGGDARKRSLEVRSDSAGRFEVDGVPTGRLSFNVSSPRLVLRADASIEGSAPIDVLLDTGDRNLEGRVLDADGRPVAGARLQLVWSYHDGALQSSSLRHAVSDADGLFLFEGLGPGPHRLAVSPDEESATPQRLEVERGVETLEVILDAPRLP
jgi:hypothetical protein